MRSVGSRARPATQDSRSGTAYGYTINDAGRISQLKIGATVTANYLYDAKDCLSVRQTLAMSPAGTTWSLYDTWDHLLAETDNAGHILGNTCGSATSRWR